MADSTKLEVALPSFERPPVNEVVLSVAFERPKTLSIAHLGNFWSSTLSKDYPETEEVAPYQPQIENMGAFAYPQISMQLLDRPPSPRIWAKSTDGQTLVQLQSDWFAVNWRRQDRPEIEYPHWEFVESNFTSEFRKFRDYVDHANLGEVTLRQCEVTYINQIQPGDIWQDHSQLDRVFSFENFVGLSSIGTPVSSNFGLIYLLRDSEIDVGRLYVNMQPAFQSDTRQPIVLLTLIARGMPLSQSEDGILSFFRVGHEAIVRSFAGLTTEPMHREWGRER